MSVAHNMKRASISRENAIQRIDCLYYSQTLALKFKFKFSLPHKSEVFIWDNNCAVNESDLSISNSQKIVQLSSRYQIVSTSKGNFIANDNKWLKMWISRSYSLRFYSSKHFLLSKRS